MNRQINRVRDEDFAPGDVSISNVPVLLCGKSIGGYRLAANYATPNMPSGHSLSVVMRRCNDSLDVGIMTDPEKIADIQVVPGFLRSSYEDLSHAAKFRAG